MVSTLGRIAKIGQMDGMDQVYFYSTINISQKDDPEYINEKSEIELLEKRFTNLKK